MALTDYSRPAPWSFPMPPPTPPSRRQRLGKVVAGLVAVALVATGAWYVAGSEDSLYPSEWDPKVRELAEFAADERKLQFKHPVYVDFLSEDAYAELATYSEADLTETDRQYEEDFEAGSRALGLVRGDVDLFESSNSLSEDGTLAYYDTDLKRVRVRGTELTVGVKATLVHELTHVLQDQHFGLDRIFDTDARNTAFHAVMEGDANRIENGWLGTLSDAEYARFETEMNAGYEQFEEDVADVPGWLTVSFGAPYDLGEPFVYALLASGGSEAIDDALAEPPASEEQLMDATRFLAGEKPRRVTPPKLPKGARLIEQADFGTLTWMFMLAERLPAADALAAVDGWGGDAYLAYEQDERVCVQARFRGDTDADTAEMAASLDRWAAAMPSAAGATVTRSGATTVGVTTCDPGVDAESADRGDGGSAAAMELLATRANLLATFLEGGAPEAAAACVATAMIDEFTLEEIAAQEDFPGLQERLSGVQTRCAAAGEPVES